MAVEKSEHDLKDGEVGFAALLEDGPNGEGVLLSDIGVDGEQTVEEHILVLLSVVDKFLLHSRLVDQELDNER